MENKNNFPTELDALAAFLAILDDLQIVYFFAPGYDLEFYPVNPVNPVKKS
jgi:hypothetical protein